MTKTETIEKGKTTKSATINLLGATQLKGKDEDGFEIWTYIHVKADVPLGGGESKEEFQRLTVTFDGNIVKSIGYELSD